MLRDKLPVTLKAKDKPRATLLILAVWLLSVFLYQSCVNNTEYNCMGGIERPCIPEGEPLALLSEYSLFEGVLRDLQPVEDVLPFDLNTPLFTDYAEKLRMVYVPEGSSIKYRENEALFFPVGSVLIKNFFYSYDVRDVSKGRKIIETRLLIKKESGWTAETYIWNEEQTEAFIKQTGSSSYIAWIDSSGVKREANYLIPTKNDCKTCHSQSGTLIPLGPKARNLNKKFAYSNGEENQLIRWNNNGILKEIPEEKTIPKAPIWNDSSTGTLTERARIYLDVNCGHCHNPEGSANNSRLFLNLEEDRDFHLGIWKVPLAFGSDSGNLKYDIVPGQPDSSILVYRMEATDPEKRMPEIGRTLVHKEAVELIREWIASLDCPGCE